MIDLGSIAGLHKHQHERPEKHTGRVVLSVKLIGSVWTALIEGLSQREPLQRTVRGATVIDRGDGRDNHVWEVSTRDVPPDAVASDTSTNRARFRRRRSASRSQDGSAAG